jgi:hypothetical protein
VGNFVDESTGVIVIGPFRSGTSLVSGLLAGLGVDFGDPAESAPPPDRYNPLGYFQRPKIVAANARYIASAHGSQERPGSPMALSLRGDRTILHAVDLSWRDGASIWGMKDPRFSATLLSWVEAGRIDRDRLRLVRVTRDIDAIAASVIAHREVKQYCGNSLARAVEMSRVYDSFATWDEENLGIPTCRIRYELLISQPASEVARLAEFVGTVDPAKVRHSARLIGRRRALFRHYVRKATHPTLLATTIIKTVRSKLASAR